jgi:hypothetical protein
MQTNLVAPPEHSHTLLDAGNAIWHLSADYSAKSYIGGIVAVLIQAGNSSVYGPAYAPKIRQMAYSTSGPKWERVTKKQILETLAAYEAQKLITPEQAAATRKHYK